MSTYKDIHLQQFIPAANHSAIKTFIVVLGLWIWGIAHAESFRGSGPLLYRAEGDIGVSAYIAISDETAFGEIPASIAYEVRNEGEMDYVFRLPVALPRVGIYHHDTALNLGEDATFPIGNSQSAGLSLEQRTKVLAPDESFRVSIDVAAEFEDLDLAGIDEVTLVLVYSIPFVRSAEDLDSGNLVDTVEIGRVISNLSIQ